jgi:hypothetical protein
MVASMLMSLLNMKHRHEPDRPEPLIRWQFERDHHHLTCMVNAAPSAYEVATVPLWDVRHAAVETFDSPAAAFHRHAAIAADLREAGWTLAAYTA